MDLTHTTTLTLQSAREPGATFAINLTKTKQAESRVHEIAIVNRTTAPNLLAEFNEAWLDLSQQLPVVTFEWNKAIAAAEQRKAVVMLDVAPTLLKEKGLTTTRDPNGTKDMRESVLQLDGEYRQLIDHIQMIEAVHKLLSNKLKALEMAYSSVKKVLGDADLPSLGRRNFSVGHMGDVAAGDVIVDNPGPIIGKPRW